jgi:hypothetical protein
VAANDAGRFRTGFLAVDDDDDDDTDETADNEEPPDDNEPPPSEEVDGSGDVKASLGVNRTVLCDPPTFCALTCGVLYQDNRFEFLRLARERTVTCHTMHVGLLQSIVTRLRARHPKRLLMQQILGALQFKHVQMQFRRTFCWRSSCWATATLSLERMVFVTALCSIARNAE